MSASVWKRNSLGKIGNFSNGVNKPKEAFGHGTKFVNISDVFLPSLKIRDLDKVEISDNEKSFYGLKKDDLLFVRSSVKPDGVGYNTIFEDSNEDIVFCGFVIRFRKSSYEIDAHFLNFLLRSPEYRKQIISFSTVSANTNINQVSLKRIEIEYPQDIKEQKHISDILSTCDTVIQNTQKTIDKYKAIKQGMMQDLFTRGLTKDGKLRPSYKEAPELYKESELGMIPKEWEIKQLKDLIISINTGLNPRAFFILNTSDARNYYVTIKEMEHGKITFLESTDRINDSALRLCNNRANLEKDDVLFSGTGTIGRTVVIKDTPTNWCIKEGVYSIKIKTNILNPFFLSNMLQTETIKNEYKKSIAGGTVQSLSMSDLSNQLIYYPIIKEQIEIAKRLSSIDSTIQKEEAVLEKYKNIKIGLMARLLTPPEDAEIIDETGE